MAKIIVIQHVPYEPLGTLDPLIKQRRHRIKYLNFARHPDAHVEVSKYDALVVLGGPMNVGQEKLYPHLEKEKALILEAHVARLPILGICLGAQLIAAAFGARVYPANQSEVGWHQLSPTAEGDSDPVIQAFKVTENIFQWHECTFDLPERAKLLVTGDKVTNQAFRIGDRTYGFQFHLEANHPLIERWLNLPAHEALLSEPAGSSVRREKIRTETQTYLPAADRLSKNVFGAFLDLLPEVQSQHRFAHRNFNQAALQA
ncbi:type 1 glutamine amidotransferase [Aliikangiella marina]|uniref:Type 1 glutamine amidotransferase n=1 Tax=Aliikangiella marina TaxID=1712262 RepID=A0A545TID5_9GAMM|nr:gamma-glutamyl-gamma-aminobutyrate hydrolase family protein [Aliikangiella marina]TQV76963.1 type 1 glutamine amidotransferase [Aliikangiella marina]